MNSRRAHTRTGFTLAELLVATLLMTIVLTGAYTMFHTVILHWRSGTVNEATYRDARLIYTLIERDLDGIPSDEDFLDARNFFLGEGDSLEFITIIEAMPSEEESYPRLMQVSYRLKDHQLIREEAELESPLPKPVSDTGRFDRALMEFGTSNEHLLAEGVLSWEIRYIWTPESDGSIRSLYETDTADYRFPNGLEIALTLYDPAKTDTSSATAFSKTIRLNGEASPMPDNAYPRVRP